MKWIVGIALSTVSVAWAATWTVTTADFAVQDGELISINNESVEIRQMEKGSIPWREIISIEQSSVRPTVSSQAFVLTTHDGQSLSGQPEKFADDNIVWTSDILGRIAIPVEEIKGISRSGLPLPPRGKDDIAVLQNGDIFHGVVEAGEGGIVIQKGEDKTNVKWEAISAVVFAEIGETKQTPVALKIHLVDGSICLASKPQIEGSSLRVWRAEGAELKLPLNTIRAIENEAGRIRFLGNMELIDRQYIPYIRQPGLTEGIRVLNEMRIDGRVARNVLEIRPHAFLTYISPFDGSLHFRYVCGGPGPMTDMNLTITTDGKKVMACDSISSSEPSKPVELPVKKGQQIQIEVDYGKNFDIQDRLELLEAAFIQDRPQI